MTGREAATLDRARKELGDSLLIIQSDASDVAAQKIVAETVHKALGGLDILFINAGIADLRPIEQWDEAAFDRSIALNLKGPYFLVQALLPVFSNPASIVINASVNAPHRHAGHKRVRSNKSRRAFLGAHSFR